MQGSELRFLKKRCNRADVSLIREHGIGVREKILASPSVGVGGKTHVCRNKRADWAGRKKDGAQNKSGNIAG